MEFSIFFNLDGDCREAVAFYAEVFRSEVKDLMTYRETPPGQGEPVNEADLDKIMYACVPIGGMNVMFMDMPTGMPLAVGNNLSPTLSLKSAGELRRVYAALACGEENDVKPETTFFSPLYAMVTDKYGVIWQLLSEDH